MCLVAASSKSKIPDDFEVTHLLVGPDKTTTFLIIELLNKSNENHWMKPGCIVGELQADDYADTSTMTPEEKRNIDFLHQFKLNESNLSDTERN